MKEIEEIYPPEKTCKWYVTEDFESEDDQYPHCEDNHGFCLIQDFYTKCYGKCNEYFKNT